jgi:hypothetical protein
MCLTQFLGMSCDNERFSISHQYVNTKKLVVSICNNTALAKMIWTNL